MSVVGPTGCGKSTLLNVAAGLLAPSSGTVAVFGERLVAADGVNRRAGYMFQADALMPWRTGIDNVIAGLEFRGVPRARGRRRARNGCAASAWRASATAIRTRCRAACASGWRWRRP